MRCLSCKNKESIDRCDKEAVKNCILCANHMRASRIRLWSEYNSLVKARILRIQRVWRGYLVRRMLRLAGPGVLKRSLCHNDEEMVTMESKTKLHPFDYFSVEQDGKVWWFDQRSMIEWSEKNVEITNPFNRQTLGPGDMRRLRRLRMIRLRKGMPVLHSDPAERDTEEARDIRWLRVVQIINECGMDDTVHPNDFIAMSFFEMVDFMNKMTEQAYEWMHVNCPNPTVIRSRRWKYHALLKSLRNVMHTYRDDAALGYDVSGLILGCLNDISDPTEFVLFVLTALVQAGELAADL